jgi:hypothetical protein
VIFLLVLDEPLVLVLREAIEILPCVLERLQPLDVAVELAPALCRISASPAKTSV